MELLVPATFGADERDMKLTAVKYGFLARAASIFGVEKITIYEDPDEKIDTERASELMEKYLNYAETPPYLRKALIPFDEDLKYANIMPALQLESHGYTEDFREAVVENFENGVAELNAGLKSPVKAYGDLEEGERVTLKLFGEGDAKVIDRKTLDRYWTFEVENRRETLGEILEEEERDVLVTSAHGEDYREMEKSFEHREDVVVVFGSAWRGIPSMVERGDVSESQFDMMVDFVPEQHTRTVRTEEALFICLSRLLD